jgi:hypothetical protein
MAEDNPDAKDTLIGCYYFSEKWLARLARTR